MELHVLPIDALKDIENRFLQIGQRFDLIHSVDDVKETYYLILAFAMIAFFAFGQRTLADSVALVILISGFLFHRWKLHMSRVIADDIVLFASLFTKKHAYELLDRADLCKEDREMVQTIMEAQYQQMERMWQ